jgi:hypothetical protein
MNVSPREMVSSWGELGRGKTGIGSYMQIWAAERKRGTNYRFLRWVFIETFLHAVNEHASL